MLTYYYLYIESFLEDAGKELAQNPSKDPGSIIKELFSKKLPEELLIKTPQAEFGKLSKDLMEQDLLNLLKGPRSLTDLKKNVDLIEKIPKKKRWISGLERIRSRRYKALLTGK